MTTGPGHETRVRVTVTGRVQGVWYRAWTTEEARDLGLDGWVRNRSDGSVEAVLAGRREDIDTMLCLLKEGPPLAAVETVACESFGGEVARGFAQRPTLLKTSRNVSSMAERNASSSTSTPSAASDVTP